MSNSLPEQMVYIGIMGAGLVPAPASPAATSNELAAMIQLVEPFAVVVHPSCREVLAQAFSQVPVSCRPAGIIGMTRAHNEAHGSIFTLAESVSESALLPFAGLKGRKGSETLALVPFSR
jgi:long-subunit acyl-CoA synthetase (AMP-forming)